MSPKKYEYLRKEATAPFRTLRKFIYLIFGGSATLGGFVFLLQILANKGQISETLPSLGIQLAVIGLMVLLFRIDKNKS